MMGMVALDVRPAEQPAYFQPVDERQVQIEQDEAWRLFHHRLQRRRAGGHHLDFQVSATLERVLHQPGDIWFVLDNQNLGLAQFVHR